MGRNVWPVFFFNQNFMISYLFILFSEKSKNLKYDGIKSIIGGENSVGGNCACQVLKLGYTCLGLCVV